jgi:hypothetical protein
MRLEICEQNVSAASRCLYSTGLLTPPVTGEQLVVVGGEFVALVFVKLWWSCPDVNGFCYFSLLFRSQILQLLEFCLSTTYFVFEGKYYKQKQGAAMGSPVSPIVANLYMEEFEQKTLAITTIKPAIWVRYVEIHSLSFPNMMKMTSRDISTTKIQTSNLRVKTSKIINSPF